MKIITGRDEKREEELWHAIVKFNAEKNPILARDDIYEDEKLCFFALNDEKLLGGAICNNEYNWLYIETLYVDKALRGQNIGSKILREIENFAIKNEFDGLFVDTFDFQAKPFYEKNGFELAGTIDDMPYGSKRYTLKKQIKS